MIVKVRSALIPMSASVVLTRVTKTPEGTFSGIVAVYISWVKTGGLSFSSDMCMINCKVEGGNVSNLE